MSKHTPGKWFVDPKRPDMILKPRDPEVDRFYLHDTPVAHCFSPETAARIILAVNNFDELVTYLEGYIVLSAGGQAKLKSERGLVCPALFEHLELAKTLLKKCKGGE